ncbi:MAG TPA: class I SAM-dependent methyltransferase [Casimicrobium huifangae]|nr:class I SAM-dependent methyltransferase [Casimicrobium huifangae]
MHTETRQAHAVTDLPSRQHKALKIERLLGLQPGNAPLELLEIGCGSGGISHYFATHPTLPCRVTAVDVHDNRQVQGSYDYAPVQGVKLPFEPDRFDVVISNHVIEHVGDAAAQLRHLQEIRRVLKPEGVAYLAVPNRWMLTEPHYRLKFLSWLPHSWRSPYLRWRGKGDFYDCEPLQLHELEAMLAQSGMTYRNLCIEGWRETFEIERPRHWSTRLLRRFPDALLRPLRPIIPTLMYRLERPCP